jgi:hypothetical protein
MKLRADIAKEQRERKNKMHGVKKQDLNDSATDIIG